MTHFTEEQERTPHCKWTNPNKNQKRVGRGRIGPESKTLASLWLLMSAGETSALKGLNNDLPMHDEPGPRLPQQLELKSVVLWTSLGVFDDLLLYIGTELHAGCQ